MTNNIKVSVLTCLFRHKEEYVRQCLDSLVAQTLKECEFILIDNGADETNKALIKEYLKKDNRFCVIYLKQNIGMGAALNRGIDKAAGQYIGFLESDDFAIPEMFSELYSKSNNGNVDVVKSIFDTLNDKNKNCILNNFPKEQCNRLLNQGECSGLIQGHVSHWSGIYKKSFLQKNHIRFNETPGGHSQDFGFILQCYACAKSVFIIPKAYVTYRLFSGVHEFKYLNDCMLDECELTLKILRKKKLPDEVWEVLFLRIAPRLLVCLETADEKQKKRIKKELALDEKYQKYKYFKDDKKKQIQNLIYPEKSKHFISKFISAKSDASANMYELKILGIPVVKKRNSDVKKYIKVLGIPIYYKNTTLLKKLDSLNNNLLDIEKSLADIKNLCYRTPWFPTQVAELHRVNLLPYKNIYIKKILAVCGSGPTLNFYNQLKNVVHIGLNRSFEKENLKVDYIFAWDLPNLMKNDKMFYQKIKNYPAKKILGRFLNSNVPQVNDKVVQELDAIQLFSSAMHGYPLPMFDEEIHYDIEHYPLMDFCSVAFGAFHFALYTGAQKILLVGIDNKLSGYFTKEHRQDFLMTENILRGWRKVKTFCDIYYPNVEIISVNPVGLKGIFKDVYTNSYLNNHPEINRNTVDILDDKLNSILQLQ